MSRQCREHQRFLQKAIEEEDGETVLKYAIAFLEQMNFVPWKFQSINIYGDSWEIYIEHPDGYEDSLNVDLRNRLRLNGNLIALDELALHLCVPVAYIEGAIKILEALVQNPPDIVRRYRKDAKQIEEDLQKVKEERKSLEDEIRKLTDEASQWGEILKHLQSAHANLSFQIPPPAPPSSVGVRSNQLPETSGIYFIWNQLGRCVYVGQSKNIRRRCYSHPKADEDEVFTCLPCSEDLLNFYESYYIWRFRPWKNFGGDNPDRLQLSL